MSSHLGRRGVPVYSVHRPFRQIFASRYYVNGDSALLVVLEADSSQLGVYPGTPVHRSKPVMTESLRCGSGQAALADLTRLSRTHERCATTTRATSTHHNSRGGRRD